MVAIFTGKERVMIGVSRCSEGETDEGEEDESGELLGLHLCCRVDISSRVPGSLWMTE
jgi:hypothetical protein